MHEDFDAEDATRRAQRHSAELIDRLASLADQVAESEEKVAQAYDASARLRPHAAERLNRAARDAREFAERERRHARRVREDNARADRES